MATQSASKGKISPIMYWLGIGGVVAVAYVFLSGDDTTTAAKPVTKAKVASDANADAFLPIDYKATYPALKIEAKDAFLPLVRKTPVGEDGKGALPNSITGGGVWSYDGTVTVDNHLQALLDDTKSGESDFVSLGQHWKHGRIKRITDTEIQIDGDDGTSATMKMGEPSQAAPKEVAVAAPVDPTAAMSGAIGNIDVNALPPADGTNNGNGNAGGWGGNNRRRGGRRGGGGGMMGMGGG